VARSIFLLNNRLYTPASLVQLILVIGPYEETARQVHHTPKSYEYINILGVCASGGHTDLRFGFFHLTVPYLTFFRVLHASV